MNSVQNTSESISSESQDKTKSSKKNNMSQVMHVMLVQTLFSLFSSLLEYSSALQKEKEKLQPDNNSYSEETIAQYCKQVGIRIDDPIAKNVNEFANLCGVLFTNPEGFVQKTNLEIKQMIKSGICLSGVEFDKHILDIKTKMSAYELSYQYASVRPIDFHLDIEQILREIAISVKEEGRIIYADSDSLFLNLKD